MCKRLCVRFAVATACLAMVFAGAAGVASADDKLKTEKKPLLEQVLDRGALLCGVRIGNVPGFSEEDGGIRTGFDVDYCRAIAAAVFADPAPPVTFVPLTIAERFSALRDGTVDVVVSTATDTLSRDASFASGGEGVDFAPTVFYDGQAFVTDAFVWADAGNLLGFLQTGARVCVREFTSQQVALAEYFEANGLSPGNIILVMDDLVAAYNNGDCEAITDDLAFLPAEIPGMNLGAPLIFDRLISKEPLAPVVVHGDPGWRAIVRWVVHATVFAEEHGITMANVTTFPSPNAEEQRFLGITGDLGAKLGLSPDWAAEVIFAVGNYAEIYDRNLLPVGLTRTALNRQYTDGGLLYAPPFR